MEIDIYLKSVLDLALTLEADNLEARESCCYAPHVREITTRNIFLIKDVEKSIEDILCFLSKEKIKNNQTLDVIKQIEKGENLIESENIEETFKKLKI